MSYSNRLAVCEAFSIGADSAGRVVLEIRPPGRPSQRYELGYTGSMSSEIALALEADRVAAIRSDDE